MNQGLTLAPGRVTLSAGINCDEDETVALLLSCLSGHHPLLAPVAGAAGGGNVRSAAKPRGGGSAVNSTRSGARSALRSTGLGPSSWEQALKNALTQTRRYEAKFLGLRVLPTKSHALRPFMLEEDLLGFGLNDKCTLEGTMIEFLQVLLSQPPEQALTPYLTSDAGTVVPSKAAATWTPAFVKSSHLLLRALVFNNPKVSLIARRSDLTDEGKWEQWQRDFVRLNPWCLGEPNASDEDEAPASARALDLSYLRVNFKDFATFATALGLLQNWAMDSNSSGAAWTDRFLIPSGAYTCFWQLSAARTPVADELSGAGQILYWLLLRAPSEASLTLYQLWAQTVHERSLYPQLGLDQSISGAELAARVLALTEQVGTQLYQRFFMQPNVFNLCAQQLEGPYARAEIEQCAYIAQHGHNLQNESGKLAFNQWLNARKATWPVGQQANDKLSKANFFPLKGQRVMIQMLGDWANILSQSLTTQDLFAALGTITLLNFMVLGLEQGQGVMASVGTVVDINMVPAVNTSPKDRMRKAALTRCKANHELHANMLSYYFQAHLQRVVEALLPKITKVLALKAHHLTVLFPVLFYLYHCNEACQIELKEWVVTQLTQKKADNANSMAALSALPSSASPEEKIVALRVSYKEWLRTVLAYLQQKGKASFDNSYHRSLGKQIGLITTELTTGHCYVLSDHLVTTLVMAVLGRTRHLPWQDFLQALAERYHLIIGVKQARAYYAKDGLFAGSLRLGDLTEELRKNERALRIKLERLGLLLVLSDGCDFVKNPFASASPPRWA